MWSGQPVLTVASLKKTNVTSRWTQQSWNKTIRMIMAITHKIQCDRYTGKIEPVSQTAKMRATNSFGSVPHCACSMRQSSFLISPPQIHQQSVSPNSPSSLQEEVSCRHSLPAKQQGKHSVGQENTYLPVSYTSICWDSNGMSANRIFGSNPSFGGSERPKLSQTRHPTTWACRFVFSRWWTSLF